MDTNRPQGGPSMTSFGAVDYKSMCKVELDNFVVDTSIACVVTLIPCNMDSA